MSVFKHEYRAYTGPVTSLPLRIGVLARYALAEAWSSKITWALFIASMLPVIVFLVIIYLANNPIARALILRGNSGGPDINASFFLKLLSTQCWLALVLAAWIAPRLVSFDLADNALPILLSHPISRFGYVLGKFIALFWSLSLVTWIPCTPVLSAVPGVHIAAAMVWLESPRGIRAVCRVCPLDRASLHPRSRHVVGQMEDGGDGLHLRRGV